MKITIVTSYYHPEFTPISSYYEDIAYDLVEYGADVTVVCGIPTRLVKKEVTKTYILNLTENINEHLKIIRTGPKNGEGNKLFFRAVYHLYRSWCVYKLANKIDTDIYFVCSTPPFLGIFGIFLSKYSKTIYNLHDVFPDTLISAGIITRKNFFMPLLRIIEKKIYKKNTYIRVISKDVENTIVQRGVNKNKILMVYDWIDESYIYKINRKENLIFDILKISRDNFYVCYAGNIGLLQNLSTLIQAAKILYNDYENIKIVIIGDGAWKNEMMKLIQSDNILVFPMQDYKLVPYIYNLGDVGISTIASGVSKGSLPSKTWSILSASCPVICEVDEGSELERIIVENDCGICIKPDDYVSMANAIIELYHDKAKINRMGVNGRKYIEKSMTRKSATKKIYECAVNLMNESAVIKNV
jgi:glycosyltransferase involved in cell wall biosynthesis